MTAAPVPLLGVADLAEAEAACQEEEEEEEEKERTSGIFLVLLGPLLYLDPDRPVAVAAIVLDESGKKWAKKEAIRWEK